MSAFEVSTHHIDAMITAGLRFGPHSNSLRWYWHELPDATDLHLVSLFDLARMRQTSRTLTIENAGQTGAMLLAENRRSVNHRYTEDEFEQPYEYLPMIGVPDPVIVLKAISCFEYQSCEHTAWRHSEAYAFCQNLRGRAISQLPGYADAPWEISTRDAFPRADQPR